MRVCTLAACLVPPSSALCLQHGAATPQLRASHQLWFHQRKTAANIFTRNTFRGLMRETFVRKARVLLRRHMRSRPPWSPRW